MKDEALQANEWMDKCKQTNRQRCKWSTCFIYFIYDLVSTANKWRVQLQLGEQVNARPMWRTEGEEKKTKYSNERLFMSDNERRKVFASVSILLNESNYLVQRSAEFGTQKTIALPLPRTSHKTVITVVRRAHL